MYDDNQYEKNNMKFSLCYNICNFNILSYNV